MKTMITENEQQSTIVFQNYIYKNLWGRISDGNAGLVIDLKNRFSLVCKSSTEKLLFALYCGLYLAQL